MQQGDRGAIDDLSTANNSPLYGMWARCLEANSSDPEEAGEFAHQVLSALASYCSDTIEETGWTSRLPRAFWA